MNWLIRHGGPALLLFFCFLPVARGQLASDRISAIEVTNVGPQVASVDLVRANIHVKVGDVFNRRVVYDDIPNLYATGLFANIIIKERQTDDGVVVIYVLQGKMRLTSITVDGNTEIKTTKLLKKAASHTGDPLDELKLLNDTQMMEKQYEDKGYTGTSVRYELVNVDQIRGQAGVLFQVTEKPKIKIEDVQFLGAHAFTQKKLRSVIKTRRHWFLSVFFGSGVFKQDDFDDDPDMLAEFYRNAGYIDFELTGTNITYPTAGKMIIQFVVSEGRQYKVGSIAYMGTTLLPTNALGRAYKPGKEPSSKFPAERAEWRAERLLNRDFVMKVGDTFTPQSLTRDLQAIEDYYGSKGYIDVIHGGPNLYAEQIPNTDTGTMDLEYHVQEGQAYKIEKIEIRGNVKTRDRVIRRELAVSPGDTFDMLRVNLSKQRLEGLGYFTPETGVQARPESDPTLPSDTKNLVITVEEQSTGNMTFGAGYDTVESVTGFVQVEERNFDLFKPPYFIGQGGGQKVRLYVQIGALVQNYQLDFQEPWFMGRKLQLDTSIYRQVSDYQSLNNLYDEAHTGFRVGLTRALGSDFLIGTVGYNLEQVDIFNVSPNAPNTILNDSGAALLNRFKASLAWDSRNDVKLPNGGNRSSISTELTVGDRSYLKTEISSGWYFKGFAKGHVLEVVGRAGVAQPLGSDDVPFYDRYYLGGLRDLRGYDYAAVGPREVTQDGTEYEPIGGDTFWFGSLEYSVPVMGPVRFATFFDIGNVSAKPWNNAGFPVIGKANDNVIFGPPGFTQFSAGNTGTYSDNWGIGIHIDIPNLGPLRLDYGIPIHHDPFNSGSGKFQFGVGFARPL
jgi:outer membrane protein insertion porin family